MNFVVNLKQIMSYLLWWKIYDMSVTWLNLILVVLMLIRQHYDNLLIKIDNLYKTQWII